MRKNGGYGPLGCYNALTLGGASWRFAAKQLLYRAQYRCAALRPVAANYLEGLLVALQPVEAVGEKRLTLIKVGLAALAIAYPAYACGV
ncbi:hypothetical protein D3C77_587780 [compost metagenome]